MKVIRKRKDSELKDMHKVIIGLCSGTMREAGGADKKTVEECFESSGSSAEELADKLVYTTAGRAAENFEKMVDGMRIDLIMEMLSLIYNACPAYGVSVLQGMFYACGMEHAAKELDSIAICQDYYKYAYEYFIDQFMQADEIDWFLMERTLGEVS